MCGECDIGCNDGAKNTLDFNYLSRAKDLGAQIRTLHEVKRLRPLGDGSYEIECAIHHADGEETRETLRANRVILAAGTLGSTYLLLKSRAELPGLSDTLGTRYCTNGDLLTFAMCCRDEGGTPRRMNGTHGPVITSAIRMDLDEHRGFLIEDAGFPDFAAWLAETTQAPGAINRAIRFTTARLLAWLSNDPRTEVDAEVSRLLGEAHLSSTSIPLLGMGRDQPTGRMTLRATRKGRAFLQVDWRRRDSREYFDAVSDASRHVAERMGGRFKQNPATALLRRIITVHPLGGCPMADTPGEGVVDAFGRVFGCPGLYVADGSVMPGPVGSNPSLTIAAMARRSALHLIEEARSD